MELGLAGRQTQFHAPLDKNLRPSAYHANYLLVIYLFVYRYGRAYVRVHVLTCIRACSSCVDSEIRVNSSYICIYIYIYIYIYICICICICMCLHVHVHVHAQVHIHIHIHIHIHRCVCVCTYTYLPPHDTTCPTSIVSGFFGNYIRGLDAMFDVS